MNSPLSLCLRAKRSICPDWQVRMQSLRMTNFVISFRYIWRQSEFSEGHLFAYLSVAAAYSHGTEWLDQVIAYIKGNIDFTESYLKERIPAIRMIRPQASYLIFWIVVSWD